MLSEAYLSGLAYWNDIHWGCASCKEQVAEEKKEEMNSATTLSYSSVNETQVRSLYVSCQTSGKFIPSVHSRENQHSRNQRLTMLQTNPNPVFESPTTTTVEICRDPSTSRETYLVPPSCQSICKNYNDLHIAGGQVMAINSVTTDFPSKSSFEYGPLLKSSEISLPMEDSISTQSIDFPPKPIQRYSSYWRITSIKEKSSLQMQKPVSNAMLNEYLEQKVVELYKQYIMDTVFHDSSPTQILASELIMTSVDQISLQVSREKNLGTSKARDIVINRLLQLVSTSTSTEISTPSLHISQYSNVNP
ncbi:TLR adapter interacting with SLC15A4 on the lysosome [Choloepus didactylus]|uniref:TLR adapter interacting with SLC15A4 on the lysosome n=1 Tax=Choloepus didactylus TaxID=27675 RepID=UPI0018A072BA|nr:TLR adapter interacting with SLC15A4 on the lysosome [Choloepus didactylus]XP_037676917.1 TLR adapter interacting with SLC15A4 on the lysosome [Choloepus didactylus]XP_037676918.1 TLR adapter interacting with SLC15A4 on the lysosome [Choloepus didactylus]XP_037676920.1 TLR adapter interacting with SLC15A4 on the lysosome [Choloepus didactylus]XP_037676921.1 TLR adapter interacting with SLC15A4 on the lysosome [Choloepus didactylus]XP_037676922.1 TLR adapter interacting with SLC15A4 on the l